MFFCVFFFKQKTAYELRISDWSSDVCSSDLPERNARALRQAVAERGQEALVHRRLDIAAPGTHLPVADEPLPLLGGIQQLVVAVGQLHRPQEIGRASWRERVCTYG